MRNAVWIVLALSLAGCRGDLPPGCASLLPQCFASQQVCVAGPVCQACPAGHYADPSGVCLAFSGTPLTHRFQDFTAQGGDEILGLCQSWTLQNPTELWVNAVELSQNEASHHSNWLFVPDNRYPGPDGVWPCDQRGYSEVPAAVAGGVLYAQSTQAAHEVQKFANSAAIRIPPYSRIISDVHILNASTKPVTGHATLTMYTLPLADVKVKLAPFHLAFETLALPPHSTSRFLSECLLDDAFEAAFNHHLDMKIYYVLPHYHALGKRFFLQTVGGPHDGQSVFDIGAFDGEAHGRATSPPYDLTGADGLRFGCEFTNPRDAEVNWGFGDQEMCEMLGFAESGLVINSTVSLLKSGGSDGSTPVFTGPCGTISFKYNWSAPGGPRPDGGAGNADAGK